MSREAFQPKRSVAAAFDWHGFVQFGESEGQDRIMRSLHVKLAGVGVQGDERCLPSPEEDLTIWGITFRQRQGPPNGFVGDLPLGPRLYYECAACWYCSPGQRAQIQRAAGEAALAAHSQRIAIMAVAGYRRAQKRLAVVLRRKRRERKQIVRRRR